jgi:hypothetical protein
MITQLNAQATGLAAHAFFAHSVATGIRRSAMS